MLSSTLPENLQRNLGCSLQVYELKVFGFPVDYVWRAVAFTGAPAEAAMASTVSRVLPSVYVQECVDPNG